MFGPARLLRDGWVCDMTLRRLGCARIGDGDVVRAIVAGATQMAPRRLRGPHVAVARRGAVLDMSPVDRTSFAALKNSGSDPDVSSSTEEATQIGPNPSPDLQTPCGDPP